jgi:addiction module HigA family antidote
MHNPLHPGEVIRETCIEPLGLSVSATAKGLGVTRKALSELLNGHSGVSAVILDESGHEQATSKRPAN